MSFNLLLYNSQFYFSFLLSWCYVTVERNIDMSNERKTYEGTTELKFI